MLVMSFFESVVLHAAPLCFLRPTQMWPVSAESAPFLIGLWVCLITAVFSSFFNRDINTTIERRKEKRYDIKVKTLRNLIYMEEKRLANEESDTIEDQPRQQSIYLILCSSG
mmetsp:Transcript_4476/g.4951  ORF Transcript_4476/g.4951 Transcript_4476/m.4951 type:complete len:112 (+) Transcript_4476:688-1023(+)